MYQAIKDDRVEFIQLFLDNGFSLKAFLTNRILLSLYNAVIKKEQIGNPNKNPGNPNKKNKNKKIPEQKKVFVWIVDSKSEKSRKPKQKTRKSKQKSRKPKQKN
jgi:hypothetical protein